MKLEIKTNRPAYHLLMRFKAVALLVFLFPAIAHAWGGDGHQLVCLIAEDHLTPAAWAAIHDLLGKRAYISDAEVANWADEIRRDRPETGPWHFVDIPFDATAFDEKRDGQQGNNVIDKINDFKKILQDPKTSRKDRIEALKFLVHLVGDAHQPLHCIDRHDKGGNTRLVFYPGRQMASNLHTTWDSLILEDHMGTARNLPYSDQLNAAITPEQAKEWSKGTPEDWVNESHLVAIKDVYANIPADGPPPKLDKAYIDNANKVISQQLERGGLRLAVILNEIFR
jgi:hypothetical protein